VQDLSIAFTGGGGSVTLLGVNDFASVNIETAASAASARGPVEGSLSADLWLSAIAQPMIA
jgi:hypothetical protein